MADAYQISSSHKVYIHVDLAEEIEKLNIQLRDVYSLAWKDIDPDGAPAKLYLHIHALPEFSFH